MIGCVIFHIIPDQRYHEKRRAGSTYTHRWAWVRAVGVASNGTGKEDGRERETKKGRGQAEVNVSGLSTRCSCI